ncbi:MAG: thiol-disulfide oxidoreductase DCC family protein [Thermodesulfobacteriota bacterium]
MSPSHTESPVILFDGVCNLCTGSVNFIIQRDPKAVYRFASLQSETGKALMSEFNLANEDFDSLILFENGKSYIKSTAVIKISRHLSGLWPLFRLLIAIPKPIRDYFYDIVAKNRYKWFGKKQTCMVPSADIEMRFLH